VLNSDHQLLCGFFSEGVKIIYNIFNDADMNKKKFLAEPEDKFDK
jgi:hypothetical protein